MLDRFEYEYVKSQKHILLATIIPEEPFLASLDLLDDDQQAAGAAASLRDEELPAP